MLPKCMSSPAAHERNHILVRHRLNRTFHLPLNTTRGYDTQHAATYPSSADLGLTSIAYVQAARPFDNS